MRRLGVLLLLAVACLGQAQSAEVLDLLRSPEWDTALVKLIAEKERLGSEVTAALRDKRPETRRRAAIALGEMDFAPAIKSLLLAAKDRDKGVRREAVASVVWLLTPRDQRGIHGEPPGKIEDLTPLVKLGKSIVPALIEIVRDTSPDRRMRRAFIPAVRLLRVLKEPRSIDALAEAVVRVDRFALSEVQQALAVFDDPRVLPAIVGTSDQEILNYFPTSGIWVLQKMEARAVPYLVQALDNPPRKNLRPYIAAALGVIRDWRDYPGAWEEVQGELPESFRAKARSLLASCPGPAANAILLRSLTDPSAAVRRASVLPAVKLKVPGCWSKVVALTRDPNAEVRSAAIEGIVALDPKAAVPILVKLIGDAETGYDAVRALCGAGDPRGLKSIFDWIEAHRTEHRVRWPIEGLGNFNGVLVQDRLLGYLKDPFPNNIAAVHALARKGDAKAIPALEQLAAKDTDMSSECKQAISAIRARAVEHQRLFVRCAFEPGPAPRSAR